MPDRPSILFALVLGGMLVLAGAPALGQEAVETAPAKTFLVEEGRWWINHLDDGACLAQNRSIQEFTTSPYNVMALLQQPGDAQPRLQVMFWPGSFEVGQELTLLIAPSTGRPFEYRVRAVSDYHLAGIEPLTARDMGMLAFSRTVTIGGSDTPASLVMNTEDLGDVRNWLTHCLR